MGLETPQPPPNAHVFRILEALLLFFWPKKTRNIVNLCLFANFDEQTLHFSTKIVTFAEGFNSETD